MSLELLNGLLPISAQEVGVPIDSVQGAQLDDLSKPVGFFLLVCPSGVGKTETALALSDALYGGEHKFITINMSEFQEPHTVSTPERLAAGLRRLRRGRRAHRSGATPALLCRAAG